MNKTENVYALSPAEQQQSKIATATLSAVATAT